VNAAPAATLAIRSRAGVVPAYSVIFDSSASDPDGTVAAQVWNFGDGSPKETDPGPSPTHVYTAAGTYTVTLDVTDNRGATTTVTTTVVAP
jgi:large repetitive protein